MNAHDFTCSSLSSVKASGPCFNIWQISYLKISWWLTVVRLVVLIVTLIWNLKFTYKTYRILKHLRSRLIVRSRKFFEAARFVFRIVRSLWNGAGTSAVVWWIIHVTNLMSSRLHNFLWYDVLSDTWGRTGGLGVNTLRPRQNGRHFPDDIFKCIFLIYIYICVARPQWVKGVGVGGLLTENGMGAEQKKILILGGVPGRKIGKKQGAG